MLTAIKAWFSSVEEYVLLGTLAILASVAVWAWVEHSKVGQYQAQVKALSGALDASEASNAALRKEASAVVAAQDTHTDAIKLITLKEQATNAAVSNALTENRPWADQPVPAGILASLHK
jgi:hypothetical protein